MNSPSKTETSQGGAIAWMCSNRVAANLLMIIFLVGGLIIAFQVKQEVFPEFTTDIVRVSVPYPGASPEEVEQGIVLAVEDVVRGLDGVKRVTAVADEGAGTVVVELLSSAATDKVVQDIKNAVDRITSFPEDAERPIVALVESRNRVISLLVHGDQDPLDLRELADRVRDDLVQRPGITLVELSSSPPLEIAIEVSQENLRAYKLTLDEIAATVRHSAVELPGGEIRSEGGRILLRTQERRNFGREFENIIIASSDDGASVRLSEIADIRDTFAETDQAANFNGKPAVIIEVFRVGNETPQAVSTAVREYIEELKPELPSTVNLTVWEDSSVTFQDRMRLLVKNAIIGLILVLLLLGLFLEPQLAFWVTLGIPISALGCFLFVPLTGASINMISLFAFIVTLGIVVDDAVVTGENIFEKREQGHSHKDAAILGAREVVIPVVFAVLTNIVAFMPLFFVPGVSGKFFRQIPSIVVGVFIISLIESFFILPAHLSHKTRNWRFLEIFSIPRSVCSRCLHSLIHNYYAPAMDKMIARRYLTLSVALATLISALGLVAGGHIRFSFLPKIDADLITAQAELPVGVPIEETKRVEALLEQAARRTLESSGGERIAKGIFSQIGRPLVSTGHGPRISASTGTQYAGTQVYLHESGSRPVSGSEFARRWRKEIGQIVGLKSLVIKSETGVSEGAGIEFNLSHRSRETLVAAAEELREILKGYAGVLDIDDGVSSGKRQLSFKISEEARSLGLTARDLGRQVRAAFYGAEALRQQRGRNEVKVMVRLPLKEREQVHSVENLIIQTPAGGEIPFVNAALSEKGTSYTEINRRNGRRVVTVKADVDEQVSNTNQIIGNILAEHIPKLERKYPGLSYSFGGEREAQNDSLSALGIGFIIALLVIFALLAIPFQSYIQPLIVMISIPFGIIGAIGGHFLLGYGLSIISMFGIIALSGVVVNDSLVLVVTANRLREKGLKATEAIKQAGLRRFRPIVLTSLTTFFGLAPMIFETSLQARFLIPMAISLGFGILFATVIILIIVPAVYLVVEDFSSQNLLR